MNGVTPTRSALLELAEEQRAARDGYQFLDEKRLLLAAEMLQQLRRYETALRAFDERLAVAAESLKAAVGRHGLDGMQVYPAVPMDDVRLEVIRRQLLGVWLLEANLRGGPGRTPAAEHPSPEAEHCRGLFAELLHRSTDIAALAGNLERLRLEYRRTDRRARALEGVLIPEIDSAIKELEARLEEIEQEETMRVRQT